MFKSKKSKENERKREVAFLKMLDAQIAISKEKKKIKEMKKTDVISQRRKEEIKKMVSIYKLEKEKEKKKREKKFSKIRDSRIPFNI